MIWFDCNKCGKAHGRPETSAGALVFCDCGNGLRVPWESTTAPPEPALVPVEASLDPIRFDPADTKAVPLPPDVSLPATRRRRDEPIDPAYCFNHPSEPKDTACVDCGLSLCSRCKVTLRGQALCAPCKNYRMRLLQRRPETVRWATISFLTALVAGPLLFCLLSELVKRQMTWLLLVLLVPLAFAIAAGIQALVMVRRDPNRAGGHLALGGISLASTAAAVVLIVVAFVQKLVV
jgi:hypothetical protein